MRHFNSLSDNILVHNLAKGIPFDSATVDVVYHSHFLEHLDRDAAIIFMLEVKRVLKTGGILRIVVPDFEKACKAYLLHIESCEKNPDEISKHDAYVSAILEQSVRKESFGTSQQPPFKRFIENFVLGNARKRGETHQWMYDRYNLNALLFSVGLKKLWIQQYNTSQIPNWNEYGLDLDERGNEYKPGSLYIEAEK